MKPKRCSNRQPCSSGESTERPLNLSQVRDVPGAGGLFLKSWLTHNWKFTHVLLTLVLKRLWWDFLIHISIPECHRGEKFHPIKTYDGRVLHCKQKQQKKNLTCVYTACAAWSKFLEDVAVYFVPKNSNFNTMILAKMLTVASQLVLYSC